MSVTEPIFAIVNGAAGVGRCRRRFERIRGDLERHGIALAPHFTEAPGHATTLARQADAAGNRRFLVVGGDGTTFEVINGLFPRAAGQRHLPWLCYRWARATPFLREFDIADVETAVAAVVRGDSAAVDGSLRSFHSTRPGPAGQRQPARRSAPCAAPG